eukprot:7363112-Alexandrium_andersonii.AAC.1
MAERGPAEPSRRRSEETTSSQASADSPSGAWTEWHVMSATSRPSMPGWRPGRMTWVCQRSGSLARRCGSTASRMAARASLAAPS